MSNPAWLATVKVGDILRATQDLYLDGVLQFANGTTYEVVSSDDGAISLLDEEGDSHIIYVDWFRYFVPSSGSSALSAKFLALSTALEEVELRAKDCGLTLKIEVNPC